MEHTYKSTKSAILNEHFILLIVPRTVENAEYLQVMKYSQHQTLLKSRTFFCKSRNVQLSGENYKNIVKLVIFYAKSDEFCPAEIVPKYFP